MNNFFLAVVAGLGFAVVFTFLMDFDPRDTSVYEPPDGYSVTRDGRRVTVYDYVVKLKNCELEEYDPPFVAAPGDNNHALSRGDGSRAQGETRGGAGDEIPLLGYFFDLDRDSTATRFEIIVPCYLDNGKKVRGVVGPYLLPEDKNTLEIGDVDYLE